MNDEEEDEPGSAHAAAVARAKLPRLAEDFDTSVFDDKVQEAFSFKRVYLKAKLSNSIQASMSSYDRIEKLRIGERFTLTEFSSRVENYQVVEFEKFTRNFIVMNVQEHLLYTYKIAVDVEKLIEGKNWEIHTLISETFKSGLDHLNEDCVRFVRMRGERWLIFKSERDFDLKVFLLNASETEITDFQTRLEKARVESNKPKNATQKERKKIIQLYQSAIESQNAIDIAEKLGLPSKLAHDLADFF